MNITARLHRLESQPNSKPAKGLPVRPEGMSDSDYMQTIKDLRKKYGNKEIPIMELAR